MPPALFFGAVVSNKLVVPPIFVERGLKIDAKAYLLWCVNLLRHNIKPWVEANFVPGTFIWQQDGTVAHTMQDYLRQLGWELWTKTDWPPSLPDCAPLAIQYGIPQPVQLRGMRHQASTHSNARWHTPGVI